jgi:hypothetical protein
MRAIRAAEWYDPSNPPLVKVSPHQSRGIFG